MDTSVKGRTFAHPTTNYAVINWLVVCTSHGALEDVSAYQGIVVMESVPVKPTS